MPPLAAPPRVAPFARELARFGDATAVHHDAGELSYGELAARVGRVAERLGPLRRLVLVAGGNDRDTLVAYLAGLAGGHPVLLCPGEPGPALDGLLAHYDPDVVVHRGELRERRAGTAHDLHPDLALLLSTSGSSGSPKLVRLSHDNLQANAESVAAALEIRSTDRAATTLPLHYCYGLSVINSHLVRGASLVLTELSVVDACFWELARRAKVSTFAGVPYTFDLLDRVRFADMDLPHLRYVTQAGGRMPAEQVVRYARLGRERGWDLVVMYGQTEATARMACLPPDLAERHPETVGRAVPGGSFMIEPVAAAPGPDVGELVYAGPNVMLGYAEQPGDLALGRTVEVLRTGDLARRRPDGLVEIVGRHSRIAKVLGVRVDLDEAERLLAGRGLTACAAEMDGRLAIAVAEPAQADRVRIEAARTLGVPARSVRVVVVDRLPRLASGKPDPHAVARLAVEPAGPARAVPPPGADVGSLRTVYAEVLERDDVTEDSSFVDLGGDSLSYVEASVRLEEALGALPLGWHTMPLRELAQHGGRHPRWGRSVETGVVLRAVAVLLIVGTHARLFNLPGSAHLLIGVAGFNFARFQLTGESRRARVRGQLASVARIAVPAIAWVAAMLVVTDDYGPSNLLLLNVVVGPETWTSQWHLWFVEVLVWLLLLVSALLAVPWVDRWERRFPFGLPVALTGIGLLGRYGVLDVGIPHTRPVLWLFAMGWAAARARSGWQRLLVAVAVAITVPGFFGQPIRDGLIAVGLLLLVTLPAVRCPRRLTPALTVLASASLYVYLVHWQVYVRLGAVPVLAVACSVGAGVAYWLLVRRLTTTLRDVLRRYTGQRSTVAA